MVEIEVDIEKYKGDRPRGVRLSDRDRRNREQFSQGYDVYIKTQQFLTAIDMVCMSCFQKYTNMEHCPVCGTDDFWTGEIGRFAWYSFKYGRSPEIRSLLRLSGFNPVRMNKEEMIRELLRLVKDGDVEIRD